MICNKAIEECKKYGCPHARSHVGMHGCNQPYCGHRRMPVECVEEPTQKLDLRKLPVLRAHINHPNIYCGEKSGVSPRTLLKRVNQNEALALAASVRASLRASAPSCAVKPLRASREPVRAQRVRTERILRNGEIIQIKQIDSKVYIATVGLEGRLGPTEWAFSFRCNGDGRALVGRKVKIVLKG